jgi:lipoyl-dependent peroxiredoxin
LSVDLRPPSNSTNPQGTNPEQLFGAAYSACFAGAMDYVAKQRGQDPGQITIVSKVALGPNDAGEFVIAVDMDVTAAGLDQKAAEELVAAGNQACPYSKATRGNIDVKLTAHGGK